MCGGIVNNQIKKGLLLTLPVKFVFKSVTGKKVDCVVHVLRLSAVWWPGLQSAQDNHLLACNFAKYSLILETFLQSQQ